MRIGVGWHSIEAVHLRSFAPMIQHQSTRNADSNIRAVWSGMVPAAWLYPGWTDRLEIFVLHHCSRPIYSLVRQCSLRQRFGPGKTDYKRLAAGPSADSSSKSGQNWRGQIPQMKETVCYSDRRCQGLCEIPGHPP